MSSGEFDIIARYFNRQTQHRRDVPLGIGDDCALLTLPEKKVLAVSTDTLVCGTHFLPNIDPADLAYKSLAVNLSDLAAMGADPAWLSLAITLPTIDEAWLQAYSDSLFEQLDYYGMQLIGGDTTKGPLSLTLTIFGHVPVDRTLARSGAHNGDWIYVTGTLGDSAAGLAILQKRLDVINPYENDYLVQRHLRPQPRILAGQGLRDIAGSVIDLSDGLVSDLGHILKASGCGAIIDLDQLPLSEAFLKNVEPDQRLQWALAGGEDYELCFSVSEANRGAIEAALNHSGVGFTCIGQMNNQEGQLTFKQNGQDIVFDGQGFDHFKV